MIKTLNKLHIERMYHNKIQAEYDKHTANIILNGEKLNVFPLRSGIREGFLLLPLLFTKVTKVPARTERNK